MISLFKNRSRKAIAGVVAAALAACSFAVFASVDNAGAATGCASTTLRQGSSNAACVKEMKLRLNAKLGTNYNVNGPNGPVFGASTKADVVRFQNSVNLRPADGIVGPQTWAALYGSPSLGGSVNSGPDNPANGKNVVKIWGRKIPTNCSADYYTTVDVFGNSDIGYTYRVWMANTSKADATAIYEFKNGLTASRTASIRSGQIGKQMGAVKNSVYNTNQTITVTINSAGHKCSGTIRMS